MNMNMIRTISEWRALLIIFSDMFFLSFSPKTEMMAVLTLVGVVIWTLFLVFFPIFFLRDELLQEQEEQFERIGYKRRPREEIPMKQKVIVNVIFALVLGFLFWSSFPAAMQLFSQFF